MVLLFTSVLLALSVSALCSLLEATLLSLTPSQVADISSRRPQVAAIWQRFKQKIEQPIAVILIINTAAHTIGATIAGAQFEVVYGERWLFVFSLVFTFLMLEFTEILPKTLGVRYNRRLAAIVARPLDGLVLLMSPVLRFINLINRPFARMGKVPEATVMEEISALASAARLSKLIDADQERMIRAASRFQTIQVRQIMTPRTQVDYLIAGQPLGELLQRVQKSAYTRLPLCEGSLDRIIGIIHMKDLFNHLKLMPGRLRITGESGETGEAVAVLDNLPGSAIHVIGSGQIDLRKIKREPMFVPELLPLPRLLRQFQQTRNHMAIVVDEYGAMLGLVTLEDVIEELVGEIEDEFDVSAPPALVREGDHYRVGGLFPLHQLREELSLPELQTEGVQTVGGYIVKQLGHIPRAGDAVPLGPFTARVLSVDQSRITELLILPASDDATSA